jgi:triosephosphate isomerase (TIM)
MASRKPFVGGNWKMNLSRAQAISLAQGVVKGLTVGEKVDVAVFPAFVHLADVAKVIADAKSTVKLGAQDFYFQPDGAYTGEVSLAMLKDLGVQVVLIGHSERRHVFGETDSLINKKVRAALAAGFEVILCVGEKLEEREAGMTDHVNMGQTLLGLAGLKPEQIAKVTIAYEPVWAIGTGKNATKEDAQAAHARLRGLLQFGVFSGGPEGERAAKEIRIQYGGSMKPGNAAELFSQLDIDGGLIGGASLKAEDFLAIVTAASAR